MKKQSKLLDSLIKIVIFYAVVSWLLGEWNPAYWINDKRPSASISEIMKMTPAELQRYKKDVCEWTIREAKRNPGLIIEAQAKECTK